MEHGHDQEQRQAALAVPPPAPPVVPPMPAQAPATAAPLVAWLRMPRPEARPGIWRAGHVPRPAEEPDRVPTRQVVVGAVVSALAGWLLYSLLINGYLGSWWLWPVLLWMPDSWYGNMHFVVTVWIYYAVLAAGFLAFFGKLGQWPEVARRARAGLRRLNATAAASRPAPVPPPEVDPAAWPELRAVGAPQAADRLSAELHSGRMTDVDHARITHALRAARSRPEGPSEVIREVLAIGSAARVHESGRRDLPNRTARHDLTVRQVRLGAAADTDRTPWEYRGAGIALDPAALGTSMLVVGPSGSGKTTRVVRPIAESLCLQALARQAAVVVVAASGAAPAPDAAFDAIVRVGAEGTHALDLYAGTDDADTAGAILAEALVGDLAESMPGGDSRRVAIALAQLLGAHRAVHGAFPDVAELRDLLDGTTLAELRAALESKELTAYLRELDAYARQTAAGDVSALLASRVAMLDRPALAGCIATPEGAESAGRRLISLRDLDRPIRVRVDLPERAHADAARILARLVLAQFNECAVARPDRSLFAGLVLDDAALTVTAQALRGIQHLRSGNAGVVLALRGLDDVPERLRAPLLGAVGCRVVCAGVTPWDGEHYAAAWGTEWVQTQTVTNRDLVADEPMTKVMHGLRRLATGRAVTAKSVTVRTEERQRWSASQLANEVPAGHAVISMTTVQGERTPPILTKLGE